MTRPQPEKENRPYNLDFDRESRCGFAEVVYGPGKTPEVLCEIVQQLIHAGQPVLVTRVEETQKQALLQEKDTLVATIKSHTNNVPTLLIEHIKRS